MKTTRLSLLLLIAALLTVMLAGTQQSATSASEIAVSPCEAGSFLPEYEPTSAASIPVSANLLADISVGGSEGDVLTMYANISTLSLKRRRAAFRNASPTQKSAMWRTHLALFLLRHPEFNQWQKAVILSAMALATPEYFGVPPSDPAWKTKVEDPSRLLEQRIFSAFSIEDAAKIFAKLGEDAGSAPSSASVLLKSINYKPLNYSDPYKQVILNKFVAQDFELEQSSCECSRQSDYCPMWSACGGSSCASTGSGCGTLWSYPCNGACR